MLEYFEGLSANLEHENPTERQKLSTCGKSFKLPSPFAYSFVSFE